MHALTQWGDRNGQNCQAIVQIFPELPGLHLRLQIDIGCGDHAAINPERVSTSYALHLALLKEAQDLALQGQRHVADLIQKKGATVSSVHTAVP